MKKVDNLLWGLVFIIVGVIFGLNAFNITSINVFFDGWWTMFIIIPCFIGLFKEKNKTFNIIGLIIGLCLFLKISDIIKFDLIWKLLTPTILIIIGLSFIFKDIINSKIAKEVKKLNKKNKEEYYSCFSSQTFDICSDKFDGCTINAIFGGAKCDLSKAKINNDICINACSIFGGITIYVPDSVNVKITSTCLFGGVTDERKNKVSNENNTIYINATSMFGGVEIK